MSGFNIGTGAAVGATPLGGSPAGGGWGLAGYPRFLPPGTGMPLAKGSELVLQIHYHPSGKEEQDQSELAIYFSKTPAKRFVARVGECVVELDELPVRLVDRRDTQRELVGQFQ